ncbi:MAG: hypothetical protein ABWY06_13515 [Pseudomonas sp.]|uniref:hypothetical protein n=1 Tax=Pseudomonas sp. TaxID=306 RepID=UPI003399EAB7
MFDQYFQGWEVRPEFQPEFISLWEGWLGPGHIHELDQVAEPQWQRFNALLKLVVERYDVLRADPERSQVTLISNPDEITQSFDASMAKDASQFVRLVIPALGCVLAEDWDFTYILWYKDQAAVDALAPLVESAGLHHFRRSAA